MNVEELSDENYKAVLNNMGDPVFVKDDQSRLVLVNDAFCAVFGRSRAEIIGKTLAEDVSPEEREHFFNIDRQVVADGKESIVEERLTVRDGETKTISTRKTRFIDKTGKRFLVGVIRDITEIKLAEELNRINRYNEFLLSAAQILSKTTEEPIATLQELAEKLSLHFNAVCDISVFDSKSELIVPQALHHQDSEVKRIIKELFDTAEVRKGQGLVGRVIETGEEILIKSVPDSMKIGPLRIDKRIVPESIMYVPLKGEKETLGSLNLSRLIGQPAFTDFEVEQIRRMGDYLSLFVENVLLKQQQREVEEIRKAAESRLAEEKRWADFKLEVSSTLADVESDLPAILQRLCEHITEYFDVVSDVQLVNKETQKVELVALHHHDKRVKSVIESSLSKRELDIGEGMVGSVVKTGKEFYVAQLPERLKIKSAEEKIDPLVIPRSFVYLPLKSHDRVLGTLDITRLSHQHAISEYELDQMRDLAEHAARFIENRMLQVAQANEIELRKRAEQKLARNSKMLESLEAETRSMLNAIPIYIARISKDLRYVFLNEFYENMNRPPRRYEGKYIKDVLSAEVFEQLKPNFERALAGHMVNYEYNAVMEDGKFRCFNVALAPDYSELGDVKGFYSCAIDVTEKVLAEKERKLTQDRFESLSLNSGDAFFFHDEDQNILDVNQVAVDMLGYDRDELLSLKAHQIDPRWNQGNYQKFLSKLEANVPQTFDTTIIRKDGLVIPIESRFVKRVEGGKVYIQSLLRDRTEKREQELKLQRSEERLRLIFDNVEDYIATVDELGMVETINKTAPGLDPKDVIGSSVYDFYNSPETISLVKEKFKELVRFGTGFEVEDFFIGPDGAKNIFSIKYIGIFHSDAFYKTIVILRDITAQRDREQSVMNAALKGQEQERKRLGAELHDGIGQVLSAIALQVSQVREAAENEKFQQVTEGLHDLSRKLQSTVKEVRNISHDLMPDVLEGFGLKEAINQTCSNLQDRTGISVSYNHIDVEPRYDPAIEVNLYRITQELLNNIQKHAESKRVYVSLMDHGDTLSLTVEDDGVGFDTESKMNGIGLRNVHSRVNMIKGVIDVESANNSGTLINIEVPKSLE